MAGGKIAFLIKDPIIRKFFLMVNPFNSSVADDRSRIIDFAFGIAINKDIVRRVLAKHYRPAGSHGRSWLSFIGHAKDSLWSIDLFRCESILLRSHWVMVVMDVFTLRIIGFGVDRASWGHDKINALLSGDVRSRASKDVSYSCAIDRPDDA